MKGLKRIAMALVLAVAFMLPSVSVKSQNAVAEQITTTATGYTKASQVKYNASGKYLANWGARGEDCVFLSEYAEDFYTGGYTYDTLSAKKGGSSQTNASSSALYKALQSMMTSEHSNKTSYGATREMYRYTDCLRNDTAHISSFYSGKQLTGTWDGGDTWNREHTWPNSKGLGGQDEDDIIMLRPTWKQENSSRGNTAYGESGSYFDPGESTRGDCARIFLYVYVRWGNTSYAWGTKGVMESMSVLLKWMEEDPVDTWEMGRNDVVEDITGTRNVFVDYPEYAWLLFGKEIPENMNTPSGIARLGNDSSSEDSSGSPSDSSVTDSAESSSQECRHVYGKWFTITPASETTEGKRRRVCELCDDMQTEIIPKLETSSSEEGSSEEVSSSEEESSVEISSSEEGSSEEVSSSKEESFEEVSSSEEESFEEVSSSEEGSSVEGSSGGNGLTAGLNVSCASSVDGGLLGGLLIMGGCAFVRKRKRK